MELNTSSYTFKIPSNGEIPEIALKGKKYLEIGLTVNVLE